TYQLCQAKCHEYSHPFQLSHDTHSDSVTSDSHYNASPLPFSPTTTSLPRGCAMSIASGSCQAAAGSAQGALPAARWSGQPIQRRIERGAGSHRPAHQRHVRVVVALDVDGFALRAVE